MQKDNTTPPACVPLPKAPDDYKTKYRCAFYKGQDTKWVCQGGTDTTVPGWTQDPKYPCYVDQSPTDYACKDSTTKYPCIRENHTDIYCRIDQFTQGPCYFDKEPHTKTPCVSDSRYQCKPDSQHRVAFLPGNPDGDAVFVEGGMESGVLGCPPLSPLALADDHPYASGALAQLHEDLQQALTLVESRQAEIQSSLQPRTVAEANQLETALSDALDEVRALKTQLEKDNPQG
jgi:hypothetical protein